MKGFYPSEVIKFCPYCGSNRFPLKSEKHFECEVCHRKWYINEVAAVAGLITTHSGELLLTRRKFDPCKGMLDLPGGFVDLQESAEEALTREIYEELNLKVDSMQFFGSFPNEYLFGGMVYTTLDLTFFCTISNFAPLQANDDVQDYTFINIPDIKLDDIGFSSIKRIVSKLQQSL